MAEINQKEYLKKYLSGDKEKKKKKVHKVKKAQGTKLKIIDDDLGLTSNSAETAQRIESLTELGEDAPQVVGMIDERPLALRLDDYRKSDKWIPVGERDEDYDLEYLRRNALESKNRRLERPGSSKDKTRAQEPIINAATVIRDRKTGKIRDFRKEAEDKRDKEKAQAEQKEKYDKWGKGLKQVADYNQKLNEDVYEMSKPLARYADDEDLEKHLKDMEREGDPMLQYMRNKKRKQDASEGKLEKPQFDGEFMPNRFGIRPGHRWDGVDRSSGYEKAWFDAQNAKKAKTEIIYKWSTEDM